MVLDKTGTITAGAPNVTDVLPATGPDGAPVMTEKALMKLAAALEKGSEHPLAEAIMARAEQMGIAARRVEDFQALPLPRDRARAPTRSPPATTALWPILA